MNHHQIIKHIFNNTHNTILRLINNPYNKISIQQLSNHIIINYFNENEEYGDEYDDEDDDEDEDDNISTQYTPINTTIPIYNLCTTFTKKFSQYFHNLPLTLDTYHNILDNTNPHPNLFNIQSLTKKDLKIILEESFDIITYKLFKQIYKHFTPNHTYTCDPEVNYKITNFLYYNNHPRKSIFNTKKFILTIDILPKKLTFLFNTFGYKYTYGQFPETHEQFTLYNDDFLTSMFHTRCMHYRNIHYMFKREYLDIMLYYYSIEKSFIDFYKTEYPKCQNNRNLNDNIEKNHPNYERIMFNMEKISHMEQYFTRRIEQEFTQYEKMYNLLHNSCMKLKIDIPKKLDL